MFSLHYNNYEKVFKRMTYENDEMSIGEYWEYEDVNTDNLPKRIYDAIPGRLKDLIKDQRYDKRLS